jgi:tetratricopeptide (TPR) repeat protein
VEIDGKIHYEDVDQDLFQELVVNSGIPVWETYRSYLPWRNQTSIYKWDGEHYSVSHLAFDPPEFRFQAINDADLAFFQEEYAKALELFQQAIFDERLKDFSPEIRENLQAKWDTHLSHQLTPTPVAPDPNEYPRLAAYAYYRMIIIHTQLGELDAAKIQYDTALQKFPANNPGHAYVEMASAFWEAYNSSGKMANSCEAAIQYAEKHPEVFIPLGGDYHGMQSYEYIPLDMCSFK